MKILIINIISLLYISVALGHEENRYAKKELTNNNHYHKNNKNFKK